MRTDILLAIVLWAGACAPAQARLRIVATVPDLVDITRRIGGDLVVVDGLARGTEDIHQVVLRPSFVSKLNKADAVVYLGLSIEHSFLLALLDVAANPRMRSDPVATCLGSGCIDCSKGLAVLEVPQTLSRAEGEQHAQGNPHYNLGADNGELIARNVAAGLAAAAPQHREAFEKNLSAYLAELRPKVEELRRRAAPLKGLRAVSVHKDVTYLGRFTGLEFVDTLELKPGIAPTPTHLARLVEKMKREEVKLIVREQHFEAKTSQWLAERTGARVAVIGIMANALPGTETFLKLQERNLEAVLAAAGKL